MTDKEILNILFKDAGVQRSALLAEHIRNVEKYLEISKEELKGIQWVDKDGSYIQMIKNKEIEKLINKRNSFLKEVKQGEEREKIESVYIELLQKPIIRNVLKCFVSPHQAANLAKQLGDIEKIRPDSQSLSVYLSKLTAEECENIIQFFAQQEEWDSFSLKNLPEKVETLTGTLLLLAKLKNKEVSISSGKTYLTLKRFLLKNWFRLQTEPQLLFTDDEARIFRTNDDDIEIINVIVSLFNLSKKNLDIALLFLKEIIGMEGGIPGIAKEAISTGNPFLFRSLFLSFNQAREFAVGGKLNSSLETKYGNLFEELMSEFGNCRGIYDGGVDVVVGEDAFDIKSGPNVMNKSMVDAFSAKQRLIQNEKLLPDISTYKIALGYGKREKLNSFMKKIDTEILTGRDAWTKITSVEYSPEIVFAIAGLVARIFGFKSLVNSILCQGENYVGDAPDNLEFTEFLASTFSPINLTSEAQSEISFINSLFR